jgi:hypothetical protein
MNRLTGMFDQVRPDLVGSANTSTVVLPRYEVKLVGAVVKFKGIVSGEFLFDLTWYRQYNVIRIVETGYSVIDVDLVHGYEKGEYRSCIEITRCLGSSRPH